MTFDELLALVSSEDRPCLCADSRLVKQAGVFVAIKGTAFDGHDFIEQAIGNGAKYVVCQRYSTTNEEKIIVVRDSAKAAALLAQASRGEPASKLTNLAVTGTNGKTTVTFFVRSIIQKAGRKCGLVGTIIYDTGATACEADMTTPDCFAIAEQQQQMVEADSKYMVIEASSHALSQNRLAAIDFKAAAFTNLTSEHLDYHRTQANYFEAKAKLFQQLSAESTAVLNRQSPQAAKLAGLTKAKILWYAVDAPADISGWIQSIDMNGSEFILEYAGVKKTVRTALLGKHNISNALAAAGLGLAAGFNLATVAAGLSALKTVPGRLEKIEWDGNFSVIVDYAHTDDALKNVLSTLQPLCRGSLRVVFGCGGDRDRTKRPRMARVAERLADFIVVTSDNPRTERPDEIIKEITAGFQNMNSPAVVIEPDRNKAIQLAVKDAGQNDIVLIAGKGHETYQIIGKEKIEFNDKEIALQYLSNII